MQWTSDGKSFDGGIRLLSSSDPDPDRSASLAASIAETVARDIVTGRYGAGEVLSSLMLAERFETSRTPIREAMLTLQRFGLVEIPPRRQPRVAEFEFERVREIYTVQASLLAMVFELIAQKSGSKNVAELCSLHGEMATAHEENDADAYFWANIAFHDRATQIGGNQVLRDILEPLRLRTLRLRRLTLSDPERRALSLEQHRNLVEACQRGQQELAGAIVRALYLSALPVLERRLVEQYAESGGRSNKRKAGKTSLI